MKNITISTAVRTQFLSTLSADAELHGLTIAEQNKIITRAKLERSGAEIKQLNEAEESILNTISQAPEGKAFGYRLPLKGESGVQLDANISIDLATKMTKDLFNEIRTTGKGMAVTGVKRLVDNALILTSKGMSWDQVCMNARTIYIEKAVKAELKEKITALTETAETKHLKALGLTETYSNLCDTKEAMAKVNRLQAAATRLNAKVMDAKFELEDAKIA